MCLHGPNAILADEFALIADDACRTVTEDTGGMILAKNHRIPLHKNLDTVLHLDAECAPQLDRQDDPSQFIDFPDDAGGFHAISTPSLPVDKSYHILTEKSTVRRSAVR